jgi:hypothetical protein
MVLEMLKLFQADLEGQVEVVFGMMDLVAQVIPHLHFLHRVIEAVQELHQVVLRIMGPVAEVVPDNMVVMVHPMVADLGV